MREVKSRIDARIERAAGSLGAYVHGFDIAKWLEPDGIAFVRETILEHHTVCFRGQDLTPAKQVEFTRMLGEPYYQTVVEGLDGFPEITEVFGVSRYVEQWHQDSPHSKLPPRLSILAARKLPPFGADTQFTNQHKAYDELSSGLKKMLEGVQAVHRTIEQTPEQLETRKFRQGGKFAEEAVHPVVRRHPDTGRKALYVNAMYTRHFKDMTPEESLPLLRYLWAHCGRADFSFRHRWQAGDVIIWDNASVQHSVIGDLPEGTERYMHRTTTTDIRPV